MYTASVNITIHTEFSMKNITEGTIISDEEYNNLMLSFPKEVDGNFVKLPDPVSNEPVKLDEPVQPAKSEVVTAKRS